MNRKPLALLVALVVLLGACKAGPPAPATSTHGTGAGPAYVAPRATAPVPQELPAPARPIFGAISSLTQANQAGITSNVDDTKLSSGALATSLADRTYWMLDKGAADGLSANLVIATKSTVGRWINITKATAVASCPSGQLAQGGVCTADPVVSSLSNTGGVSLTGFIRDRGDGATTRPIVSARDASNLRDVSVVAIGPSDNPIFGDATSGTAIRAPITVPGFATGLVHSTAGAFSSTQLAAGDVAGTTTDGFVVTLSGGVPTWLAAGGGGGPTPTRTSGAARKVWYKCDEASGGGPLVNSGSGGAMPLTATAIAGASPQTGIPSLFGNAATNYAAAVAGATSRTLGYFTSAAPAPVALTGNSASIWALVKNGNTGNSSFFWWGAATGAGNTPLFAVGLDGSNHPIAYSHGTFAGDSINDTNTTVPANTLALISASYQNVAGVATLKLFFNGVQVGELSTFGPLDWSPATLIWATTKPAAAAAPPATYIDVGGDDSIMTATDFAAMYAALVQP